MMLAVLAGATALYAQNPLTTELKQNYAQIKATVMKAADDMPDADYGFMPGPRQPDLRRGGSAHRRRAGRSLRHGQRRGRLRRLTPARLPRPTLRPRSKRRSIIAIPSTRPSTDADATKMVKMFGRDTHHVRRARLRRDPRQRNVRHAGGLSAREIQGPAVERGPRQHGQEERIVHSHSMVAGGLLVRS